MSEPLQQSYKENSQTTEERVAAHFVELDRLNMELTDHPEGSEKDKDVRQELLQAKEFEEEKFREMVTTSPEAALAWKNFAYNEMSGVDTLGEEDCGDLGISLEELKAIKVEANEHYARAERNYKKFDQSAGDQVKVPQGAVTETIPQN